MSVTIFFHDGDGGITLGVTKPTEREAVDAIYRKIKCDTGPLSAKPLNAIELSDAVSNAFGGECAITVDY